MAKVLVWTSITTLFLSLLEATILSRLVLLPAIPDLVLLVIVYVSFMNSSIIGSSAGFISGILLDFLSAAPIGLNALIKSVSGFIIGKFTGMFNLNRIIIPCIMAALATLFKAFAVWILSLFFGPEIQVYILFDKQLFAELALNVLFAPIVFGILSSFNSLFVVQEE